MVTFNPKTKDFKVLYLDEKDTNSRNTKGYYDFPSNTSSSDEEDGFICRHCGHINFQQSRGNSNIRVGKKMKTKGNNTQNIETFLKSKHFIQSSDKDDGANVDFSKPDTASQSLIKKSQLQNVSDLIEDFSRGYSTTSKGGMLSHDYFKLLATTLPNLEDGGLIEDSIENNVNENCIPIDLINQGYFDKFFKVLTKLGSGSFGSVYKVEHELLGLNLGVFALKKIPIGNDRKNLVKILNEVQFLYNLSNLAGSIISDGSAHVVKYNHVWLESSKMNNFGPEIPVVFLLFEYCDGGTLEEWVESVVHPKFDVKRERMMRRLAQTSGGGNIQGRLLNNFEIFKIFGDIVKGIKYLHDLRIIHRDLKPSNCLFKTRFDLLYNSSGISSLDELSTIPSVLVSDFGESIMENKRHHTRTGATGTLEYCAPELLSFNEEYDDLNEHSYLSDIYSLGMILYYLCFGKLPYSSEDPADVREEILKGKLFSNMKILRGDLLDEWVILIQMMVDPVYEHRPKTDAICEAMKKIEELLTNPIFVNYDEEMDPDYIDSGDDLNTDTVVDTDTDTNFDIDFDSSVDNKHETNDEFTGKKFKILGNSSIFCKFLQGLHYITIYTGIEGTILACLIISVSNIILFSKINCSWGMHFEFLTLGVSLSTKKILRLEITILQLGISFLIGLYSFLCL